MSYFDKIKIIEQYSVYRLLFTNRQQKIADMYFYQDYSLTEVATNLAITRSSVQQVIKRLIKQIDSWEQALKLWDIQQQLRELSKEENIDKIKNKIDKIIKGEQNGI